MSNGTHAESPDEELWDLLTCHRNETWQTGNKPKNIQNCLSVLCISFVQFLFGQEAECPFPWRKLARQSSREIKPRHVPCSKPQKVASPAYRFSRQVDDSGYPIRWKLPKAEAVAGAVLRHAIQCVDALFEQWAPMIFKIGFTHDPVWRWSNGLYGYSRGVERWGGMVCLYKSREPFSPAMLEAALIEKYGRFSVARLQTVGLIECLLI